MQAGGTPALPGKEMQAGGTPALPGKEIQAGGTPALPGKEIQAGGTPALSQASGSGAPTRYLDSRYDGTSWGFCAIKVKAV